MTITKSRVDHDSRRPANGSSSGIHKAAPTVETVVCRHCQGANPGSRKFCGLCGKSLWEPCPKCEVEGPATETFCGSCGANISALHQERAAKIEADLVRVLAMREAEEYEEAIGLASGLARSNPLRLETQIERARQLAAEITIQRDQRQAEAASALAKARELQATHAYETAVSVLEDIPASLRGEEFQAFHGQVRSQWQEVLALGGEIRRLLEEKRTLEMLPKLDRLIQLQPEHAQARQLAQQLRDRYVAALKKKLAAHQYKDALTLAQDIPALVRTPEVEDLQVRAAELAWLLDDLLSSPVVDKSLSAVGERLVKFSPSDERAAKLLAQLKDRAQTKPKDPRIPLPLWAAAPEKPRLGRPVEWLGGFSRLKVCPNATPETLAALQNHPGCLFVAAGLALQGVEHSRLKLNLLPKEKTSRFAAGLGLLKSDLLGKKKKKPIKRAWGIDLSDSGLKAIKLVCDEEGENPVIAGCEVLEHAKPAGTSDAPVGRAEIAVATLKKFLEQHSVADCKICISLQTSKLLARFINLPPLEKKQLAGVIEYEAKHQIPIPLSELTWDTEILDAEPDSSADEVGRRVLLLAAKHFHVQDQLAPFKTAEIDVDVLQSDAVALHNLATYEFFSDSAQEQARVSALALLDVGSEGTNVVVVWPRGIWFRATRWGGTELTKAIVQQFKLAHAQAEQLKRDPTRARRLSQLYEALEPQFEELVKEVERSLGAFENERHGVTIERLLGVGGAFATHGLWRRLRVAPS